MEISVIILTKNEEKNIRGCLESVRGLAGEIIIIDDYSEDKTAEIAEKFGAKIYQRELNGDFAAQRNYALTKVKHDWVLFLDADERWSREIHESLREKIGADKTNNGFLVKRRDWFWGKALKYGECGTMKLVRIGKKDKGSWKGKVHERWEIEGKIGESKGFIEHYPHPTIHEFTEKINFYTALRAQELQKEGVKVHFWDFILYPAGKFLVNYFFKLGFLDGPPGLVVAILMSWHSFLVRAKLYLLYRGVKGKT